MNRDFDPSLDVGVSFGPNADVGTIWPPMIEIIKDGLRGAGKRSCRITSTYRTPEAQARAMFKNLTRISQSVERNIANQLLLYGLPGAAVIEAFASRARTMTSCELMRHRGSIQIQMELEIARQGPDRVSRHCVDPSLACVVDVGAFGFDRKTRGAFLANVASRLTAVVDESSSNGCFHLELT